MIDKFVQALASGQIVAVSWNAVREHLGEDNGRQHDCSICLNNGVFPPEPLETHSLSEKEIAEILDRSNAGWMAESYEGKPVASPVQARYFISAAPEAGPWLKSPSL